MLSSRRDGRRLTPVLSLTDYEEGIAFDLDDPDFVSLGGGGGGGGLGNSGRRLSHPFGATTESIKKSKVHLTIDGGVESKRYCNLNVGTPINPMLLSPKSISPKFINDFSSKHCFFVSSNMSLTSAQPQDPFGRRRRIINGSKDSIEDGSGSEVGSEGHPHFPEVVLSIEEVRAQLQESCFSCGVSWREEHVSLDCGECGGYALSRPCPQCGGRCQSEWRRNLTLSHASGKARWEGECGLPEENGTPTAVVLTSFRVLGQVSSEADQLSSRLHALSPISSST